MQASYIFGLSAFLHLLQRVIADQRQHREARLAFYSFLLAHEALVYQRGHAFKHVHRKVALGVAHRLYRREGAAAYEYAQPGEERLLSRVQQPVAPADSVAKR